MEVVDPNRPGNMPREGDRVLIVGDANLDFAILVAKHCDGFVSFRTNATFADGTPYGYGVQQSSWRNGQGDLALDFVTSARKHGRLPVLQTASRAGAVSHVA